MLTINNVCILHLTFTKTNFMTVESPIKIQHTEPQLF